MTWCLYLPGLGREPFNAGRNGTWSNRQPMRRSRCVPKSLPKKNASSRCLLAKRRTARWLRGRTRTFRRTP